MKLMQNADVQNKRVFVRVDFNVPLKDGQITDDNRIKQALPTLEYLMKQGSKIILGTHLGKPKGSPSPETSTQPVALKLGEILGKPVRYINSILGVQVKEAIAEMQPGDILMLANLRWDPREEKDDEDFGSELAKLAQVYVNDAFAVSHRANASVSAITKFLPSFGGMLIQKEVEELAKVANNPGHPFVLVIGGVKIEDKAGMIEKLAPVADKVLAGGGVANTFIKAKGQDIGASVYDEDMIEACKKMLIVYGDKIVLPTDFEKDGSKIMDLGPETRGQFYNIIKDAAMVLWNGNLGYTEDQKYTEGSRTVALAMRDSNAETFLAGGDTAGFVINEGLDSDMTFISTGGGAALEYLAGLKLPGIAAIS